MQEKTIEVLKEAGWYPNRKIDISELVIHYEKKGFEMFPAAMKFIEEYGMLKIRVPINPRIPETDIIRYEFDRFSSHTTDMTNHIINGLVLRSDVEKYEEYVDEKLVIVGALTGHHQTLMISESGRMFTDNGFCGNNAEEFWDRLVGYVTITNWEAWDGW